MTSADMGVSNVGQQVRNAFVHTISWWVSLADPEVAPKDLNIARALKSSQLLRNMMTWFCANRVAADEAKAFYTRDSTACVTVDRLPGMMALMYVSCMVAGMPSWTHAAMEAGDLDNNLNLLARQASESKECSCRVKSHMKQRMAELGADAMNAMARLNDIGMDVTDYFSTITMHEMELLKVMQQLTLVAVRLLLVERPGTQDMLRSTLRSFMKSCCAQPEAAMDDSNEPMAVAERLAESVAERLAESVAETTRTMETRLCDVERAVKDANATACAAEQIAEAAEKKAAHAMAGKGGGKHVTARRLVAIDKHADDMAQQLAAADARVDCLARQLETLGATVDARVAAIVDARVAEAVDARVAAAVDVCVAAAVDARVAAIVDARVAAIVDARVAAIVDARVAAIVDARVAAAQSCLLAMADAHAAEMTAVRSGMAQQTVDIEELMSSVVYLDKKTRALETAMGRARCTMASLVADAASPPAALAKHLAAFDARLNDRVGGVEETVRALSTQVHASLWGQWHALQMQCCTMRREPAGGNSNSGSSSSSGSNDSSSNGGT